MQYTKKKHKQASSGLIALLVLVASLTFTPLSAWSADTALPPGLEEDTRGEPAQIQLERIESNLKPEAESKVEKSDGGFLGTATVVESKRENGQVYRIELEHSAGAKQIIEETDSDGRLDAQDNSIEDTPKLVKWRLGTW